MKCKIVLSFCCERDVSNSGYIICLRRDMTERSLSAHALSRVSDRDRIAIRIR